jgi:hypothetical protein
MSRPRLTRSLVDRLMDRILGRTAPVVRERAPRRRCDACGRVVAHAMSGRPYLHRCRVELIVPKEGETTREE